MVLSPASDRAIFPGNLYIGKHNAANYQNHPDDLNDKDRLTQYQKWEANHHNQFECGENGYIAAPDFPNGAEIKDIGEGGRDETQE